MVASGPGARIIHRADRRITPWANGSGTTSEIATGVDSRWRFSVATLEGSATFSTFPEVDRVFTIIGEHAVSLRFGDSWTAVARLKPTAFAGEYGPVCAVEGPTEAFNVMVDRSTTEAVVAVSRIELAHTVEADDRVAVLVLVLGGGLTTDLGPLDPGDGLLVERGSVVVAGPASVVIAEIVDRA